MTHADSHGLHVQFKSELASDTVMYLQVSCEGDVFMHLMAWCQAQRAQGIPMDVAEDQGTVDVKARTTLEMLSHMCVRVEHMTLVELEALDACEEVRSTGMCIASYGGGA